MTALARADRMDVILARDGATCVWCARPFGDLVRPTTEHLVPRIEGGLVRLSATLLLSSRSSST